MAIVRGAGLEEEVCSREAGQGLLGRGRRGIPTSSRVVERDSSGCMGSTAADATALSVRLAGQNVSFLLR